MKYKREMIDEILDDQEKLAVQMFIDNKVQHEAVKKVLLFGLYNNGTLQKGKKADPLANFTLGLVANAAELKLTNEDLGEQLRSAWEGIQMIEIGWNGLSLYKKESEPLPKKENPAR